MTDRVGQRLGNYTLVKLVGQGGFAEVYLGEHQYLKSQAAIKILQTKVSGNDDTESFLQEAQTIARLAHPNIIRVMDFGIEDETPYLVMDYAPNGTLRSCHPRNIPVPLATLLPYVKQISEALQYAHDEHIIHRDIKPENMLIGRRNEILLSDFGIALAAQSSRYQGTQDVIGTVAYMSPEQIQGKPRPASDQYSLAVVVYEWLTGDRPFRGSFTEMCTQHMFAPPPPLTSKLAEISPAIEQVIMRALDKDPHKRYTSMNEFALALEQVATNATQQMTNSNVTDSTAAMTGHTPSQPGIGGATQLKQPSLGGTQLIQPPLGGTQHVQPLPQSTMGTAQSTQNQQQTGTANQPGIPSSNTNAAPTMHSAATEMQTSFDPHAVQQRQGQGNQFTPQPPQKMMLPYTPDQQPYGAYSQQQPYNSAQPYPQQQQQYQQPYGTQQSTPYAQQRMDASSQPQRTPYPQQQQQPAPQHNSGVQAQRERNYREVPPTPARHTEPPPRSAEPERVAEDWLGLDFKNPWVWKSITTVVGIVLFCVLYNFHLDIRYQTYAIILVVPLFFGGAFGPLVGAIVGLVGALLAGILFPSIEPYRFLFPLFNRHEFTWMQPWVLYGLAGAASGLTMLGRRRFPSIGSAIRSALLSVIVLGIFDGFVMYNYYKGRILAELLVSGTILLVNITIALVILLVYSILARLIDFGA